MDVLLEFYNSFPSFPAISKFPISRITRILQLVPFFSRHRHILHIGVRIFLGILDL